MPQNDTPPAAPGAAALAALRERAVATLVELSPVAVELGELFAAAGFELALVGGPVRDAFLGKASTDLDFATSARPDDTVRLLERWGEATWDIGREFGTIGAQRHVGGRAVVVEVTTYRSDVYDGASRKPEVAFGDTLEGDLSRRDFTVNAMAVRLPGLEFVDPFDGLADLARRLLRTPVTPEQSFDDDPLRMMRAARFAAQLGFDVEPATRAAIEAMAGRIEIVSAERVRDELSKLLLAERPRPGIELFVETGLADHVLPELPALRLAALLHDIGKPATRRFEPGGGVSFHHHEVVGAKLAAKRLKALRFDSATVKAVARLVELHLRFHGYGDAGWTDSAVRRYVRDAGPLLERLHRLTRSDCTTRNRRKAARLAAAYDDLEARIAALQEQEELDKIRPDLDGEQIMAVLGIPPGREVGEAYRFLLAERIEHGPLGEDLARERLLAWWAARGADGASASGTH